MSSAHGERPPQSEQQQPTPHAQPTTPRRNDETPAAMASDSPNDRDEVYAPPAHIAARFYRNKLTARRKSSAASSRRNSLSSAHSQVSAHRHASRMQHNYIATHLRRASIIESRRARLADRAAHVEQVRMRAALVKATPRGNSSTTEERAMAAQVAKEKYLAKVAAACAEEVARAKRIAEEVKERKSAEEARVRLEMEERHAEAERRRAEYQRNLQVRRARRADSAEKKLAVVEEVADADEEALVDDETVAAPLTEEAASRRIQRLWRLSRRMRPVMAFRRLNLDTKRAQTETFEDMTAMVADSEVIAVTTSILTHLGLQERDDTNAALNTRTFLSAFMIIGHPVAVLMHKNGAQEQDLIAKATELVNLFEAAVARLAYWNEFTPNPMQLETLSQSYTAYTSAFAAWRLQDSSVLIEGMVASFVELDKIWQTVKDDVRGEVSADYREGIRDNQVVLLSRIRKLAGPERADTLIKKAIRESRRNRPKKRPVAEVRPRVVDPAAPQPTVTPDQTEDESEAPPFAVDPSDTSNLMISRLFSMMPPNRILTHELAINKDFKLEDKHSEARSQLYATVIASMKAGFEAGNGGIWTVSIAENVREKLLKMTKPSNGMHRLISEALDLDNIHRQCKQGVFSYDGFFEFMADLLPKLCAPFRDQAVAELATKLRDNSNNSLEAMVSKLFDLLTMIDKLNLDYTNFMIMNAAPMLIKEAAGYEQRQFARDLECGITTLEHTRRWWRASLLALTAEADRRDPHGVRDPADRPTARQVHTHALLQLALRPTSLDLESDALPETLHLDRARLQDLRQSAVRIVVLGALLLTTKNLLKRDVRSHWKHEAARLWQLLSTTARLDAPETADQPSPAQKAFSILETAHNLPPATKATVAGHIARFFAQGAAVLAGHDDDDDDRAPSSASSSSAPHFTDPVLKLLQHRLREHITARLSARTDAEHVRAASSAAEKLAASGMAEFAAQVAGVVEVLAALRRVDWECHGGWYEGMMSTEVSVTADTHVEEGD